MKSNQDLSKLTPLQKAVLALKETRAKLNAAEQAKKEPIAIVGMGLRFPGIDGDCSDPETFWDLLAAGGDAVKEVPANRWDIDRYYDEDPDLAGKMNSRWGGFLEQKEGFDASFFGISPREALHMDPQHRLLLEVSQEALERAGYAPDQLTDKTTGVFVGIGIGDYGQMQLSNDAAINPYSGTGTGFCFASGRLSYVLQSQGPSLSVDTACSSSLVAAHLACQSLRQGECRMALTGGVNMLLSPTTMLFLSKTRALSPHGRCRTFDAAADGFVRGEGCGVLVLKRLSDAQADGDQILALIRGSAVNHDGPSSGLTVPNGQAQTDLIQQALDQAGVEPSQVSYVEAHGTGTALGDPIELKAIEAVYGQERDPEKPLLVNSVKTNIGHLEAAAGIAGMIKNVLCLQKQKMAPHASFENPTPHFQWDQSMAVPTKLSPWDVPAGTSRMAGVSSFGLSGTNAHIIMEEAPVAQNRKPDRERSHHLFTLSAKNEQALTASVSQWRDALRADLPIGDVCFTANRGRNQLSHRLAIVATDTASLQKQLEKVAANPTAPGAYHGKTVPGKRFKTGFLFSGQGSQYVGMGRELYEEQPVFRAWLDHADQWLKTHAELSLLDLLFESDAKDDLNLTGHCQPALFALEFALAKTWMSWGIQPDFVMGHSLGEFTAACLAEVFTFEEGLRLVSERGRLMQALPNGGKMAVIRASGTQVAQAMNHHEQLAIAALNGPDITVISGAGEAVDAVVAEFKEQGIRTQPLVVSHAFHSPLMTPMLADFERVVTGIELKKPTLGVISNLSGKLVTTELTDPQYWVKHISQPVQFQKGIETMAQFAPDLLLEIGPQATLLGMAKGCWPETQSTPSNPLWLASLRRQKADCRQMLESLGAIFTAGYRINWQGFDEDYQRSPLDLPTYPFQRENFWIEPQAKQSPTVAPTSGFHPLVLGKMSSAALDKDVEVFNARLTAASPHYLKDHRIFDRVILPATAYFEMALAVAAKIFSGTSVKLSNVALQRPLTLHEDRETRLQLVTQAQEGSRRSLRIFSQDTASEDAPWECHADGEIVVTHTGALEQSVDPSEFWKPHFEPMDIDAFFERAAALGLDFGKQFRAIESLWKDDDFAYCKVTLPQAISKQETRGYHLHPVLLDACFQSLGACFSEGTEEAFLPIALDSLTIGARPCPATLLCRARRQPSDSAEMLLADLELFDDQGQWIATIEGARFRKTRAEALGNKAAVDTDDLYQISWKLQPLPEMVAKDQPPSVYLLLGATDSLAASFRDKVQAQAGEVLDIRFGEDRKSSAFHTVNPFEKEAFQKLLAEMTPALAGKELIVVLAQGLDLAHAGGKPANALVEMSASAAGLLHLLQALSQASLAEKSRLVLLTHGAQQLENDTHDLALEQTPFAALARTLDLEHPECDTRCLDFDPGSALDLEVLFDELATPREDLLIAYRSGLRYAARLTPLTSVAQPPSTPFLLKSETPGVLDTLTLEPQTRRAPAAHEVEIEVIASGLNFKDVLYAMGMLPNPNPDEPLPLGTECSGIVAAVGSDVTHVKPGDQVLALFAPNSMASYTTLPGERVIPKPAGLRFEEAATLSTAFLTAMYGFGKANLRQGQRVLIHAAAGGVGQAAVQLAQRAGATIFATASEGKHAFLRSLGIKHIYNSRNLDFVEGILKDTEGQGVDVVLNSLNGEYIPKNLEVLAQGGAFIEIGKIDIWSEQDMQSQRPDVTYHPFELSLLVESDMPRLQSLVSDFIQGMEDGSLKPLPLKVFSMNRASDAFRYMAQAKHIGKVVINHGGSAAIKPDASYLITGGCGALGLEVAQWMVDRGAKHLVLVGRRSPREAAQKAIAAMMKSGAQIQVVQTDVADGVEVTSLLERINKDLPPLRGILHAAGVLEDGLLKNLSWAQFSEVLAPKVAGAMNLHHASRLVPLDFFVCFSSVSAMLGSPGQSSYAFANGFLDAFAQWRQGQGLPGVSIGWGPWADGGMAAALKAGEQNRHQALGLKPIDATWGMEVLGAHFAGNTPHVGAFPIDWERFLSDGTRRRTSFYEDLAPAQMTQAEVSITEQLEALEPQERLDSLLDFLRDQVAAVLNMNPEQMDVRERLFDLGIDSLMALELKNRLEAAFSLRLSQTLVFDYPMVTALADHLAERLPFDLPSQTLEDAADSTETSQDHSLDELSESEAEALLMQELERFNL